MRSPRLRDGCVEYDPETGYEMGSDVRDPLDLGECLASHEAPPPANGGGHTINVTVRNDSGGEIDVSRRAHARGVILELMRRGKP